MVTRDFVTRRQGTGTRRVDACASIVLLALPMANSIAVYVMSWTMERFVSSALVRHLGTAPFLVFGAPFEPVLKGFGVLLVFWLILFWMYRRRIFLRI